MKQRRHAELIKAWADGAEIECVNADGKWVDCPEPFWVDSAEYRIKPEPRPDVIKKYNVTLKDGWAFVDTNNQFYCPANLILFFDGVSGHLRKAEVL